MGCFVASIQGGYAASSVRALGSAGTYVGTAQAVNAKQGGESTTIARSGNTLRTPSVRLTPTASGSSATVSSVGSTRVANISGNTTAAGTRTPSVMKNIRNITVKPTGGGTGTGSGNTGPSAAEMASIIEEVDKLSDALKALQDRLEGIETSSGVGVQDLDEKKQDKLQAGDYILIEDDEKTVSIDIDTLKEEIKTQVNGCDIEMILGDDGILKWKYAESSSQKTTECQTISQDRTEKSFVDFNSDEFVKNDDLNDAVQSAINIALNGKGLGLPTKNGQYFYNVNDDGGNWEEVVFIGADGEDIIFDTESIE